MTAPTLANRRYLLGLGMFTESAKYFAGWIAFLVIGAFLVPAIVAQWRSIDISAWYHAANIGKIFTAIVAGTFLYALLPNMVAQGVTRRELATATGVFGLLWSAACGLLVIAGFLAEHAYYDAFGWNHAIDQESADLSLGSFGAALEFGLHYPLTFLVYFTGGALIGAATYRSDNGWLALAPVVPIGLALDDMLNSDEPWGPGWLVRALTGLVDDLDIWVASAIALAFVALGAWATRRILLSTPIRAKAA